MHFEDQVVRKVKSRECTGELKRGVASEPCPCPGFCGFGELFDFCELWFLICELEKELSCETPWG